MNYRNDKTKISKKAIFRANYENLEKISDFIQSLCDHAGLSESTKYIIQLSVDEACSNIIEHGYISSMEQNRTIECECKITNNELIIQLHDYGLPFNPIELPNPELSTDLEKRARGGLGLFFIKQYMDKVIYKYVSRSNNEKDLTKHGNYLTLVKRADDR